MRLRAAVHPPLHLDFVNLRRMVVKVRLDRRTRLRLFGPLLVRRLIWRRANSDRDQRLRYVAPPLLRRRQILDA